MSTPKASAKKKEDNSPKVPQRDKIDYELRITELDWTPKQKAFIDLALHKDTRMVFFSAPAGASKTILAVYSALQLLQQRKASEIIYVRTIVESATVSLGSLPGEFDAKFAPFATPMIDKLEELLAPSTVKRLFTDNRIKPIPVNYLRGASYNANVIIADEVQNFTLAEAITLITRIGKYSKFYMLGDPFQTDLKDPSKSGFKSLFDLFNTDRAKEQGIHCVEFGKEDIMRSEILKFIVEELDNYKKSLPPVHVPRVPVRCSESHSPSEYCPSGSHPCI
jgi:phosphate starvation-inducible protein PhoH